MASILDMEVHVQCTGLFVESLLRKGHAPLNQAWGALPPSPLVERLCTPCQELRGGPEDGTGPKFQAVSV